MPSKKHSRNGKRTLQKTEYTIACADIADAHTGIGWHRDRCKNQHTYKSYRGMKIYRYINTLNAMVHVAGAEAESDVGEAEQPNLCGSPDPQKLRPTRSAPCRQPFIRVHNKGSFQGYSKGTIRVLGVDIGT